MGKSLIIKGADFSANGIEVYTEYWYVTLGTDLLDCKGPNPTNNSGSAAWSFSDDYNSLVQGKTINLIRFVPADAGEFKLFVLNSRTASLGSPVATITVNSADVGNLTKYEFPDVQVGASQYLCFVDPSQTVRMYYAISGQGYPLPSGQSFYKRCGFSNASVVSNYQLLIDVGYKEIV